MKHALVTGGNGFLGRYIVERLLDKGSSVRVIGRRSYPELERLGVECKKANLQDSAAIEAACEGIDTVFHVASHVSLWGAWDEFYKTNIIGTRNVIAACKKSGVKRLIYTSTPSVAFGGEDLIHADESTPLPKSYTCNYPKSKAIAEAEVLAANGVDGLATCSLRPHLLWGPRDTNLIPKIVERAKQGRLVIVGDGDNVVDFTYIENAADAHILAAENLSEGSPVAGNAYFISQDEPVKLWDFIGKVLDLMDVSRPKRRISKRLALRVGSVLEGLFSALPFLGEPPMTRFLAAQLATSHYFSNESAKRDFGYEPQISVEEGLRKLRR